MSLSVKDKFVDFVLSKEGCDYIWPTAENRYSGKDLPGALFKNVYDCSGLITAGVWYATDHKIDWRGSHNCRKLIQECKELSQALGERPKVGDLAFYGPGINAPTHVMMYCADGRVFGAGRGGGPYTTTPEIARKKGARVGYRPSHLYRPDFLGFFRLPLE